MSLLGIKPFNYPISINVEVTNSTQIQDNNWSFTIQLTSNVTTWEITPTLADFKELHRKLKEYKKLDTIKLPRSLAHTLPSEFKASGTQIIEDYLWRLLRRAYIFISLPMQTFIELPIIMEQKTNLLSKQLDIIMRDDIILYSIQNNNKYIDIQCMIRSSYIFDAYKIPINDDYHVSNELNEGFGDDNQNKQLFFRIDVVQIKRVLKYQKEFKFAIETRKGIMYAFKCKNKTQFNHWLNDIKNMIKAQGGCTPYLTQWENNEFDNDDDVSDDDDPYDFDFNDTRGPLSTISEMTTITSMSDEKNDEYMEQIEIVDIDIKSCIDEHDTNFNSDSNDVSIEHTIYGDTEEDDDDDDDDEDGNNQISDEMKSITTNDEQDRDIYTHTVQNEYVTNHGHDIIEENENSDENGSVDSDENTSVESNGNMGSKYIESDSTEQIETYNKMDDIDPIKMQKDGDEIDKPRRNSANELIAIQKYKNSDRWNDNKENRNMIEYGVTNHFHAGNKHRMYHNKKICNIQEHRHMNNMVSIEDYNLLKEQMFLWQSKANRWEAMANKFERHIQKSEIKTRDKEAKYKHKIKDQSNEILTLTKLYNCAQMELENKIIELKQLESASNIAIQQLVSYKNKNEMRKKNSYIDGTLWKFTGDGMNNIKFGKAPRLKYVMYVPTKRKLYYSDSQHDDAETKLVNVTFISHRNQEIMANLPNKYKNIWIKIIGQNRIVLFVAKNEDDADRWYDTIKNSLQAYDDDD